MHLRRLAWLSLAAVAACSENIPTPPPDSTGPSFAISDGTRTGGNPDFFFLPPMVANPSNNPNFQAADFNPNLIPTVQVCFLPGANEAAISATTVPDCTRYSAIVPAPVNTALQLYQASWTVPNSADVFYRIRVSVGGTVAQGGILLGFADVESVPNPSKLKDVDKTKFVGQQDGSSLPIKFRIEIGALCDPPGSRPCNSSTLNFGTGGSLSFSTDGGTSTSGVNVPGGNSGQHTLTLQKCPSFNDPAHPELAIIDIPVFGSCVRVKSIDAVGTLTSAATVTVCDVGADPGITGLSHNQEDRITLHQLDGSTVKALPHAAGCPITGAMVTPSLGSVLAELGHGHLRAAGGKLLAILAPTPLYARRLHLGGGGQVFGFSDFQFALPAKMEITAGDNQVSFANTALPVAPTVKVTDLGGDPVKNATVHFATTDGSVTLASFTTGTDGLSHTSWTLGSALGSQHMTASGRGIGGADPNNGPRVGVDPWQPLTAAFGDATEGGALVLGTGTQTFTATALGLLGASSGGGGINDPTVEPNPGSVFAVNTSTGVATLIGSTGVLSYAGVSEMSGIEVDPTTGTLYGLVGSACSGAKLITINPATGAGTFIGGLTGAGFNGTSGTRCVGGSDALAIASNGTMYAGGWQGGFTGGSLLRLDKTTGAVLAASPTTGAIHLAGLTFDASGNLWASRGGNAGNSGPGEIYTINPANGQTLTTLTVKTGGVQDFAIISDLAFGPDGVMYAALPRENKVATIDLSTGEITRIGSLGGSVAKMSGLAFRH